jgi:CDP-6-deoxy-D-xylo-4-hexulose-3-dehydrase
MKNAITWRDKFNLIRFLLLNDKLTNGPKVREFETQWAEWVGSKHALMVSSGSTANFLMLAAIKEKFGLKNGDKVVVPACTWVTNVSPVIQLGFQPLFCDINLTNYSFDLDHLKQIKKEHPDVRAVFVTHLLGFSADNETYQEIFPNALIIDDVCESHGCLSPDGSRRGSNSLAASFSFYFGHHMTTVEGGMINTNDSELYELMRMKRSHGLARESGNLQKYATQYPDIHEQFLFMTDGYNFRSSEINAVIGQSQLPRLDRMIEQRRKNFKRFTEIIEQHTDKFYPVVWQESNSNFAFPFVARDSTTTKVMKEIFTENGIEHRPIVGGNLLRQPFLKGYDFACVKEQYNVDLVNDNGVYIGNSHFVTEDELEWLSDTIKKI